MVSQSEDEEKKTPEETYQNNLNNFKAFEYGLDGDRFAANFSNCAIATLDWWFYEVNTFKVKMHYANYDESVTNTTLFL